MNVYIVTVGGLGMPGDVLVDVAVFSTLNAAMAFCVTTYNASWQDWESAEIEIAPHVLPNNSRRRTVYAQTTDCLHELIIQQHQLDGIVPVIGEAASEPPWAAAAALSYNGQENATTR
jgi:hypothetical protein